MAIASLDVGSGARVRGPRLAPGLHARAACAVVETVEVGGEDTRGRGERNRQGRREKNRDGTPHSRKKYVTFRQCAPAGAAPWFRFVSMTSGTMIAQRIPRIQTVSMYESVADWRSSSP